MYPRSLALSMPAIEQLSADDSDVGRVYWFAVDGTAYGVHYTQGGAQPILLGEDGAPLPEAEHVSADVLARMLRTCEFGVWS